MHDWFFRTRLFFLDGRVLSYLVYSSPINPSVNIRSILASL